MFPYVFSGRSFSSQTKRFFFSRTIGLTCFAGPCTLPCLHLPLSGVRPNKDLGLSAHQADRFPLRGGEGSFKSQPLCHQGSRAFLSWDGQGALWSEEIFLPEDLSVGVSETDDSWGSRMTVLALEVQRKARLRSGICPQDFFAAAWNAFFFTQGAGRHRAFFFWGQP